MKPEEYNLTIERKVRETFPGEFEENFNYRDGKKGYTRFPKVFTFYSVEERPRKNSETSPTEIKMFNPLEHQFKYPFEFIACGTSLDFTLDEGSRIVDEYNFRRAIVKGAFARRHPGLYTDFIRAVSAQDFNSPPYGYLRVTCEEELGATIDIELETDFSQVTYVDIELSKDPSPTGFQPPKITQKMNYLHH